MPVFKHRSNDRHNPHLHHKLFEIVPSKLLVSIQIKRQQVAITGSDVHNTCLFNISAVRTLRTIALAAKEVSNSMFFAIFQETDDDTLLE